MLAAGVPLFLCMPPWNDVTLHDMVVRTIRRGGVIYRDVFDTNLPGIDWCMAAVRWLFGTSYEALRAADLVVIGLIVAALCGWVRRCGGTGYAAAWFVVAAVLFYPFQSEFCHVQRDPWMMLPAVVAARLRVRRVSRGWTAGDPTPASPELPAPASPLPPQIDSTDAPPARGGIGPSVLEGFVWGLAVWVKPHVVVPALAVWLVSAVLLARREPGRRVLADLGGLVFGGLLAGAPGVLWLIGTGAWPYFLDVFLNWNPAYLAHNEPLALRFNVVFNRFRPWSCVHFAAGPLAVAALWEARVWSRRAGRPAGVWSVGGWLYTPARDERAAAARALLAACYLAWAAQVVLLQKTFDYAHVPLTFLGLAVLAGQRWCVGLVFLVWFVAVGAALNVADVSPPVAAAVAAARPPEDSSVRLYVDFERHPLADRAVLQMWPRCWTEGGTPAVRDRVGQYTGVHCGTRWEDLTRVAEYLRGVEPPLGPRELNCWHDSTHPLYLMLDLDPATRYMHFGTAFGIEAKAEQVAREVATSPHRYVVSDLLRTTYYRNWLRQPRWWRAGDPLPLWLPPIERTMYPWNQPVVFRSGRYVVHKVERPLGVVRVPDWNSLDYLPDVGEDE